MLCIVDPRGLLCSFLASQTHRRPTLQTRWPSVYQGWQPPLGRKPIPRSEIIVRASVKIMQHSQAGPTKPSLPTMRSTPTRMLSIKGRNTWRPILL